MDEQIQKRYGVIKSMTDRCGIAIQDICFIAGGRTNEAYTIYGTNHKKYIARIAGEGTEKIINRSRELHNIKEAARVNIAPEVYCAENGNLLIEFLDGISKKDITMLENAETLDKVTTQLRNLHTSGAEFQGKFSFLNDYNVYRSDYFTVTTKVPAELAQVEEEIVALITQMEEKYAGANAPLHGDTALQNFMICKDRAYLIDWEYSSSGDYYLDLANFVILNDLTPELEKSFLRSYEDKMHGKLDYGKFLLFKMAVSFMWVYWHLGRLVRNIQIDYNESHWKKCLNKAIAIKAQWQTLGYTL
jgi:thiamine kinase-like enzyme